MIDFVSYVEMRMPCSLSFLVVSKALCSSAGGYVRLVECMPCRCTFMYSCWVSLESVNCFVTFFTVTSDQASQFTLLMALNQVAFVGKPAAEWRYRMTGSMLRNF